MNVMGNTVIMRLMNNVKHASSWKGGKHFGNTGLKCFTLMGLMKRKNTYTESSFRTFLVLVVQFFNHFNFYFCFCFFFFICIFIYFIFYFFVFFSLSSSWPIFGYTFVSQISLILIFNGLKHYILLLPVICYFLSFFLSFFFFFFTIYLYYLFICNC